MVHGITARRAVSVAALALLTTSPSDAFQGPKKSIVRRQVARESKLQLSLDDSWADVASTLVHRVMTQDLLSDLSEDVKNIEWTQLLAPGPAVGQIEATLADVMQFWASLEGWMQLALVLVPLELVLTAAYVKLANPPTNFRQGFEPYQRGNYDPLQAKIYYAKHPLLVLQRALQLFRISNAFIANIVIDKYVLKQDPRQQRAQELLALIQTAGPTAIKVGQALSVRPDLIPTEYATALSTLQDRVPPFDTAEARTLMESELGSAKYSKIKDMTKTPMASASIGQVYKARIGTKDVAVKVQRPNALNEIALDLFLVREYLAPLYQWWTRSATDFSALANEWGRGFIAELDYTGEAANTMRFNTEMAKRNLTAVTAPVVVSEYSTDRILVTEWVDGVRLDKSDFAQVPRLCSVALNAYLVMLLELQSLHCDPHPGNLLVTTDGRLCILDFGMTLDIDPTLQYSLLEFVAHLTGEDFDQIPQDLVKLGFLKAERLDTVRASGFLEPLTYMLKQAGQGGGADKVRDRIISEFKERYPGMSEEELRVQMRDDMKQQMEESRKRASAVTGITMEVEELQKRNADAFSIPSWFVYTSRAFLTLEGVSLQADENFSIIKSCFPYVAKRLVGDDSPRAQKALKDLLYGAGDAVDAERLSDLADGFATYTTTTKSLESGKNRNGLADAEAAITLAKDASDILLAKDGNLVQTLLVEESALATSANVKDALFNALVDGPRRFRESLPLGIGSMLPILPIEDGVRPFLRKTESEEKAQTLVGKLAGLFPQQVPPSPPVDGGIVPGRFQDFDPEQAAFLAKELRENIPRYAPLVGQLGGKFASTLLKTASANIESTLKHDSLSDELTNTAAKTLSNLASRGAEAISPQKD
jgi:predicted unusual protein kinase regulating ubiquinone biosynthesis (AarF/ABC1/UbiB family)